MKRDRANVAASVRDRLLNQARTAGADAQLLATRYVIERLLYRLSISPYKEHFVLKGAMLFPAWTGDVVRPTRDLDLLGYGDNAPEALAEAFKAIACQETDDDGVVFDADGLTARAMREEQTYSGVRIKTVARIGRARYPVQVDIGFGDAVTPEPDELDYPTLLDFAAPRLRAYPRTTVVAEKFEAMVRFGLGSTRIKDFYDLIVLSRLFEFEGPVLADAIRATFDRRGTEIPSGVPPALSPEFAQKPEGARLWRQFIEDDAMIAKNVDLSTVLDELGGFVLPPAHAAASRDSFQLRWIPGRGGW